MLGRMSINIIYESSLVRITKYDHPNSLQGVHHQPSRYSLRCPMAAVVLSLRTTRVLAAMTLATRLWKGFDPQLLRRWRGKWRQMWFTAQILRCGMRRHIRVSVCLLRNSRKHGLKVEMRFKRQGKKVWSSAEMVDLQGAACGETAEKRRQLLMICCSFEE